jgi:hypothetical protein
MDSDNGDSETGPGAQTRLEEMRWRARFEIAAQNERDTIQIGIGALQTAVLINAGALVALLAFVGQVWDKDQGRQLVSRVLGSTTYFLWGLISAALAFVFAYFYQWATTRRAQQKLDEFLYDRIVRPLSRGVLILQWCTRVAMILLTLSSFGAFIWGTFSIVRTFIG